VAAKGSPKDLAASPSEVVRQFIGGLPDGPVPFHFPAADYFQELLAKGEQP
jgi:phospholipid/cholesterol/gamma-HCH transport system ATP-binding protein